jgi:hypothetical protein
VVSVEKEGYYTWRESFYCNGGFDMEVYLIPTADSLLEIAIMGKVLDRNGNPIEGAKVSVIPDAKLEPATPPDTGYIVVCPSFPRRENFPVEVFTNRNGEYLAVIRGCVVEDSGCVVVKAKKEGVDGWYEKDGERVHIFLKNGMEVSEVDITLELEEEEKHDICFIVHNECECFSWTKLVKALVELYDERGYKLAEQYVYSDSFPGGLQGCFRNMEGDTFYLKASAEGFRPEFFDNAEELSDATPIVNPRGYVEIGLFPYDCDREKIGKVMGKVTSRATGDPIEKAIVKLYGDGEVLHSTFTDIEGNYTISCVIKDNRYRLSAEAVGYEKVVIDTNLTEDTTIVNFVLKPEIPDTLGIIRGYVMDADGNCLEGASVVVYPIDSDNPIAFGVVKGEFDTSNVCWYFINNIPVDTYHIFAIYPGYESEWYNDKRERGEADEVFVHKDGVWVNFVLDKIGTGRITGRIKDTAGTSIQGALVWARSKEGVERETISGRYGEYVLEVPGNMMYEVGAEARGFKSNTYKELIEVSVGETEDGIDIVLTPLSQTSYKISGRVTDDSTGEGIFPAIVVAISLGGFCGVSITDSVGNYVIENVPEDDYYLVFACAPLYIPEFYDDALTLEEATLVEAGQSGVDFGLKKVPGVGIRVISGKITDKNAQPIEGAIIHVLDGGEVIGGARSNKEGKYMIRGIPDGVYSLKVERMGYKKVVKVGVDLVGSSEENMNIKMDEAGVEEEREVRVIRGVDLKVIPTIPSNGLVEVVFALPREMGVRLVLYDVTGREVVVFVDGKVGVGIHSFNMNTTSLPRGVYFLKLITPTEKRSEKLLLLH